jgi:serine/threonine protein kinase
MENSSTVQLSDMLDISNLPSGALCYSSQESKYPIKEPHYQIIRKLSSGGQSHVYLATAYTDINTGFAHNTQNLCKGSRVAIKFYKQPVTDIPGHTMLAQHFKRSDATIRKLKLFGEIDVEPATDFTFWFSYHENNWLSLVTSNYYGIFPELMGRIEQVIPEQRQRQNVEQSQLSFTRNMPIVLEYIEGSTLEELFTTRCELSLTTKENIAKDLLQQIDIMQREGFVHKDISPSNIIVTKSGTARLIDYSFADLLLRDYYLKNVYKNWEYILGSDEYSFDNVREFIGGRRSRPPEVYCGYISPKHDSYSVGALLYTLFTGEHMIPLREGNRLVPWSIVNSEPLSQDKNSLEKTIRRLLGRPKRYEKLDSLISKRIEENANLSVQHKLLLKKCCRADPQERSSAGEVLKMIGWPSLQENRRQGWHKPYYFWGESERAKRELEQARQSKLFKRAI